MEARQRRSFTNDYKRQAVDLVASSGRSIGSVAKELGLRDSVLRRWVEQRGAGREPTAQARRPTTHPIGCHGCLLFTPMRTSLTSGATSALCPNSRSRHVAVRSSLIRFTTENGLALQRLMLAVDQRFRDRRPDGT